MTVIAPQMTPKYSHKLNSNWELWVLTASYYAQNNTFYKLEYITEDFDFKCKSYYETDIFFEKRIHIIVHVEKSAQDIMLQYT